MFKGCWKSPLAHLPQMLFGAMMFGELWSCIDWFAYEQKLLKFSENLSIMMDTRQTSAKRKLKWNRPRCCSASESLLWVLVLNLCQRQPTVIFLEESLEKVIFVTLKRQANQYKLILVDTSWYNWYKTTLHRRPAGRGIQCIIGGPFETLIGYLAPIKF